MKKILSVFGLVIFALAACSTAIETPVANIVTPNTITPPVMTDTPVAMSTLPIPSPSPTPSLDMLERPVFLAWPLPPYIGTARISQYPNSPWSWNYLGLNEGYQCPPAFGYLLNLDSLPYWRDTSIPEEQDKAQADPHQFEMVECYSTEGNPGENGHVGTDIKAPAGTPVYASADGKVQEWRLTGLNSMIVLKHCLGGNWDADSQCIDGKQWYTTYMHIVPKQEFLQENKFIAQGDELGSIYDQTINSHLHFATGLERRSYANSVNPWGRDEVPWDGCMWIEQSICVNPDSEYKRVAIFATDGKLLLKQGDREFIEIQGGQDVKKIHLWGNRIAVLDSENRFRLVEGYPPDGNLENWQTIAENVLDFQITQDQIAFLDKDKRLFLKHGGPNNAWVLQAENIEAFSLSEYRIGYITENGSLFVKENAQEGEWVEIAQSVVTFQLIRNRIAFVTEDGNLYVNEGEILGEYQQMANNIRALQLTDVRLGIIDIDDNLLVKEGNLRAEWILIAENVQAFQMADYRILMLGKDGSFKLKEGNLYQTWNDLPYSDLKGVFLNGKMPVYFR